jgi:hypothetical protein
MGSLPPYTTSFLVLWLCGGREWCPRTVPGDECVFIPGEGLDWQMRSGPTTIPDTADGEGVRGAAKPRGVIHRYVFNPMYLCICEKAAENGASGSCFWRPFHRALPRGPRRFKLVLYSCAKAFYSFESLRAGCFLTFFPPPILS